MNWRANFNTQKHSWHVHEQSLRRCRCVSVESKGLLNRSALFTDCVCWNCCFLLSVKSSLSFFPCSPLDCRPKGPSTKSVQQSWSSHCALLPLIFSAWLLPLWLPQTNFHSIAYLAAGRKGCRPRVCSQIGAVTAGRACQPRTAH